jgi:hypothetical protein
VESLFDGSNKITHNIDQLYIANGLNQLISAGPTVLGYDGRGNLTSSGADVYAYTSENRMGISPNASLFYNAKGRLLLLTPNANSALQGAV